MSEETTVLGGEAIKGVSRTPSENSRSLMQPIAWADTRGWLHLPTASTVADTGVVLCTGPGRDASTAYRFLRMLADRLAASGYPTVRFDYPGTGDACDPDMDDSVTTWRNSISATSDWLRARVNARRVILIGLRAGALLAALSAAERTDVAGVVLLEPVLRGRSFVSQLLVQAKLQSGQAMTTDQSISLDGLVWTAATLRRVSTLELRTVQLPGSCNVAVFCRGLSVPLAACVQTWNDERRPVFIGGFQNLEALLRPAHLVDEPSPDFSELISCIRTIAPERLANPGFDQVNDGTVLHQDCCRETSLRFGEQRDLFGILCEPERETKFDLVVLIGNTGGDPHYGFARFSVELSRRLARVGIASLRLDFAGLGDSIDSMRGGEGSTQVFNTDRTGDFQAAIEALALLGYRRFALSGLCSGAYHAYQGGLTDPRIEALLLINLPWFSLRFERPGPKSFARRSMEQLASRGVRILLLFAGGDAGLSALVKHFGPAGQDLPCRGTATVSIMADIDHNLTGAAMREHVVNRIIDFLSHATATTRHSNSEYRMSTSCKVEV